MEGEKFRFFRFRFAWLAECVIIRRGHAMNGARRGRRRAMARLYKGACSPRHYLRTISASGQNNTAEWVRSNIRDDEAPCRTWLAYNWSLVTGHKVTETIS